jgi:DNA polymerase III epsilon subunit-like protein
MTTSQFEKMYLRPRTARLRCSVVDALAADAATAHHVGPATWFISHVWSNTVGPSTWFISHVWSNTFADTLDSILKFFEERADAAEAILWFVAPVGFEAQDLQPYDVTASDLFVIERIFRDGDTPSGKVSVQGYFPGHESQRKEWNKTTTIEVSRGGAVPPPKGTKLALHRPKAPDKPSPVAFNGKMAELLKDAETWEEAAAVIRSTPMVFFDYETTGLPGPGKGGKNEPVQIGAVKVVDGKVVDRFSSYMNPEHELSDWSIDNLKQLDGSPVTDDWLKRQISKREAHEAFLKFVGDGPVILGGQYTPFDLEILGRTLNELGLSIDIAGTIDSKDLASGTLPKWNSKTKIGPNRVSPKDGKTRASCSLGPIAEFLQVQLPDWHRADADAKAAWEITDAMLTRAIYTPGTPTTFKLDVEYNKKYRQYQDKLEEYVAIKAIAAAWNCGGSGLTAAVGPENGPCSVPDIETFIREASPAPIGEIDPNRVTGGSTTNETPTPIMFHLLLVFGALAALAAFTAAS